jgi:hypothetical protein
MENDDLVINIKKIPCPKQHTKNEILIHSQSPILLILFCAMYRARAQIYGVQYDTPSGTTTNCAGDPLRVWSYQSNAQCVSTSNGYEIVGPTYKYINSTCNAPGSNTISLSFCQGAPCDPTAVSCQSRSAIPGNCVGLSRLFCGSPPPESVLFPNGTKPKTYMRYSEFTDPACTKPSGFIPYNQTKLDCYRRYSQQYERAVCSSDGTSIAFTYWDVVSGSDYTCDVPEGFTTTNTTTVQIGQCVQDPNLFFNPPRYILVHECLKTNTQTNNGITHGLNLELIALSHLTVFVMNI